MSIQIQSTKYYQLIITFFDLKKYSYQINTVYSTEHSKLDNNKRAKIQKEIQNRIKEIKQTNLQPIF